MSQSAIGADKILWASLFLFISISSVPVMTFGQPAEIAVELVAKRFSSGYFPIVDAYVEYEVKLTNHGDIALENQSLWVSLTSESNKTHSFASYSMPLLAPNESKNLHLGPFKMHGEGDHQLLLGMNSEGNSFIPNEVLLDYQSDSFKVYQQGTISAILIAIPLIAIGAGIVGLSLHKKMRGRHV